MQLLSPVKFLVVTVICLGMYRLMEAGGLLGADKELLNYRMYRTVNTVVTRRCRWMDRTVPCQRQIVPNTPKIS
jgi:hypothetical protein